MIKNGHSDEAVNRVVDLLHRQDQFSKWAGIQLVNIAPGVSAVRMTIREEMVNGFGICHGGIIFSLADTALALAANSYGKISLALDVNISYTEQVHPGDVLTAEADEQSSSNKVAVYNVTVTNQNKAVVALFRGTVYKTGKEIDL